MGRRKACFSPPACSLPQAPQEADGREWWVVSPCPRTQQILRGTEAQFYSYLAPSTSCVLSPPTPPRKMQLLF